MNKSGAAGGRGGWWAVKWALVLLGGGLLAWRMTVVGISQQLVRNGSPAAVEFAVQWSEDNPDALFARAFDLSDSDPKQAERLLLQAIWLAPTNGRMFSRLGQLLERRGETAGAEQAMQIAEKLAARNSFVQADLAEFWGRRNQAEPYLRHLVTALDLNPDLWDQLHPALLAVVDNPAYEVLVRRVLSEALAERNPFWWRPFFFYARSNASHLDTVRMLYSIRTGSHTPPTAPEYQQFLARLEQDKQWLEAYFVWLNGLDEEHLAALGNIFNGSFSLPLMNVGYGWRFVNSNGVEVSVGADAAGGNASDGKALRVSFSGRKDQQLHLAQYLMLPPGNYQFSGRVRAVALDGGQTPYWRIACMAPEQSVLKDSQGLSATPSWQVFGMEVSIPAEGCELQQLRLLQQSVPEGGKTTRGTLLFDDLVLRNLD